MSFRTFPFAGFCWQLVSLIFVVTSVGLVSATPQQPICTGCFLSAGFEVVSYTEEVATTTIASEIVIPIVYDPPNGTAYTTTTTIFPSIDPNGVYATDLTWSLPTMSNIVL